MDIKTHSDTWKVVERWSQEEERRATERLVTGVGSEEQLRGRIKAMRELQGLPNREEKPVIDSDNYVT